MIDKGGWGNSGGQGHTRVCRGAGKGPKLKGISALSPPQLLAHSKLLSKILAVKPWARRCTVCQGSARACTCCQ